MISSSSSSAVLSVGFEELLVLDLPDVLPSAVIACDKRDADADLTDGLEAFSVTEVLGCFDEPFRDTLELIELFAEMFVSVPLTETFTVRLAFLTQSPIVCSNSSMSCT